MVPAMHRMWLWSAALLLVGCGDNNNTGLTMLTTMPGLTTFPPDDDDDDDGETTNPPTSGTSDTDAPPTSDPSTSDTTAEPETSSPPETTDDTATSAPNTTDVCPAGALGCPCDGGACDGGLVCDGGVCVSPSCGDGSVDPGEDCDDGPGNADDAACTDSCQQAACGDGLVWAGEEACDDGPQNGDTKACLPSCEANVCGDGFVLAGGEECDDGPQNGSTKACLPSCSANVCGDGFVHAGVEACDDGNADDTDACTNDCELGGDGEEVVAQALGLSIPDGTYNGTTATMACVDLVVQGSFVVDSVRVTVAADHTWVGDLTFKLYSPNNAKVLALMSLPGVVEAADNGAGSSAEDANMLASSPLEFRDGGAKSAEQMGDTLLSSSDTVCQTDAACEYAPNKGAAAGLTSFAGFAGTSAKGTWKFCAGDSVETDSGIIEDVTLRLNLP
jgi:cysteine-rich repeat protein